MVFGASGPLFAVGFSESSLVLWRALSPVVSLVQLPFEIIESANMPTAMFVLKSSSLWQLTVRDFSGWPVLTHFGLATCFKSVSGKDSGSVANKNVVGLRCWVWRSA